MDRTESKANIKDKNLSFDNEQLNSIQRNLNKDDFNLLNYLVDNEYSKLMNLEDEIKRVFKPYEQWGKKFRPNIQSRYRLLIDEIQSEKHQVEKIGQLTNSLKNEYTKYHWKFPHEQIKEQLTEEELQKFGYCGDYQLIDKMRDITKEYLKNKPNDNEIKV
jgi:archaellum component FlaC